MILIKKLFKTLKLNNKYGIIYKKGVIIMKKKEIDSEELLTNVSGGMVDPRMFDIKKILTDNKTQSDAKPLIKDHSGLPYNPQIPNSKFWN